MKILSIVGAKKFIEAVKHFEPQGNQRDVFGDGKAAVKVAAIIARA